MPSDARTPEALRALQPAREAFLSAVATAADGARGFLAAQRGPAAKNGNGRTARELGPFAAGRLDAERFGAVFAGAALLDAPAFELLTRAQAVLDEIAAAGDALFVASVAASGDLRATVEAALAHAGRGFGAARLVELARAGRLRAADHATLLEGCPPVAWTRSERELAPPLVVEAGGAELRQVGALAEYLQGAQKIVLVVQGSAPPAALVRLVTPGTFVLQAESPLALSKLAAARGPGIAALVGPEAAAFVHDPGAGHLADRLVLGSAPGEAPRALRGYGREQQAEEMAQLLALATETTRPAAPATPASDATPADMLAAWLLRHANLADLA
jgi:hypothetical protein